MANFRSTLRAMVLGLGLVPLVAGAQSEADFSEIEPIELRLAHVVNEQDGFHIAAEKFETLVEERTDGAVSVEIFPNAQLGDERTLLESMQIGTVDMGVITNGPVANFVEEIAVFELPFLFPSREAAYQVLDGPVGQDLLDELERVNLKGLAYAERGFRNLTNSRGPVTEPSDLDGLKLRVMENPVYVDTFRELGANAVPMAWTEALTAMQQGTIDGQENPVNVIHSFELNETQTHMTLSRHTYAPAIFVMGMPVWSELPEPVQSVIEAAAQEAAEYERQVNEEMEAEQLAELKASGMEVVEDPDLEAFRAAVDPVYDQYSDRFGEYLSRIRKQLD
ncbi:C4-dicarboxylate ABC transporter substrate-binding protein [Spiribacter sp. SSL99]|uniref:TRAP transporter substrate-binding protein n=1 Tax=Spiribacter sp. SSL99 TaxID=1866884 RepID=UPI0013304E0F|nr:TRAP transporter substrate-binding protein [Spiribacter sp. SSL99]KAF0286266.1 C4-dicarboxylate ABC transporter substrate-binding protein [Spiribacter sp. SSL99]